MDQQTKKIIGKLTFANDETICYENAEEFLKAIKDELPYQSTTGMRIESVSAGPEIRKAVDDLLFDFYGQKNPRQLEEYFPPKENAKATAAGLPEVCFSVLGTTGELICIRRGEMGYYPSDWTTADRIQNEQAADRLNEKLKVTPAQRQSMEIGSMFGWDVPGADPAYFEAEVQNSGMSQL